MNKVHFSMATSTIGEIYTEESSPLDKHNRNHYSSRRISLRPQPTREISKALSLSSGPQAFVIVLTIIKVLSIFPNPKPERAVA